MNRDRLTTEELSLRIKYEVRTKVLFETYSRFVPNMTRQDGSTVNRLLATRFGSGQISVPGAALSLPIAGAAEVTPPTAQPPPVSLAQAVPLH